MNNIKQFLVLISLILFTNNTANASPSASCVENGGYPSGGIIASPSTTHTTGRPLVVFVFYQAGAIATIGNTLGDMFTSYSGSPFNIDGTNFISAYHTVAGSTGADVVTINFSPDAAYRTIVVCEVTNADAISPFNTQSTATATSTSIASGSLTASGAAEDILLDFILSVGPPITSSTGNLVNFDDGDGHLYFAYDWKVVSSTTTITATSALSAEWGIFAVSIKGSASVGGGTTIPSGPLMGIIGQ
jgi:hypothetical protein